MGAILTRGLEAGDVPALVELVAESGVFRPEEVEVAREVLEAAATRGAASGYRCDVAEVAGQAAGFSCYGPTPCTVGTFDLYWLVVRPRDQGSGVASRLLALAEQGVGEDGGRLLVAETSDTPPYEPARRFYEGRGFLVEARLPDFYRPGDAKVIYVKTMRRTPRARGD